MEAFTSRTRIPVENQGDGQMEKLDRLVRKPTCLLTIGLLFAVCAFGVPDNAAGVDKSRLAKSIQDQRGDVQRGPLARGSLTRGPVTRDRGETRMVWPGARPRGGWTLGVDGSNLTTGVRLDEVYPGTAAWRVGLERRDMITTVNGFQVGVVGRGVYALERELNLRADARGRDARCERQAPSQILGARCARPQPPRPPCLLCSPA